MSEQTFEHQVEDMYASQKFQIYSSLRCPETHFRPQQSQQRAGAAKGSINII